MRFVRWFPWPFLVLSVALAHSACGDDSGASGPNTSPTDAGADAGGSGGSAGAGATGGASAGGASGSSGASGAAGTAGDSGPVCTPRDQISVPPAPSVDAPNACPAITACGGPIENKKWVYSKVCIDEDIAFAPMFSECPNAQFRGIGDVELSGSLELTGGAAKHSLSLHATGVFHAPAECHACGCKDFQAVLIKNGAGPNTYCYPDCNPDDSTCRCLVDYDLTLNEQPSYTISGSSLSAGTRSYDFCATASSVTLGEKGSTPAFPGTAELVPESSRAFPEICDGLDNDQNGQIDDAIVECPTECNTKGVCAAVTRRCMSETGWICEYTSPDLEQGDEVTCDGLDNDCDGMVDEGLTGCVEICDGLDNDNNGKIDDNPQDPHCPLGLGVCAQVAGTCRGAAGWECAYTSNAHEATESRCDGLDNDCDGSKDEGCSCATGKSKLFVVRWGRTPALLRADLDGKNAETVAPLSGFAIMGLSIDAERNKIYFYDGTTLKRASLDGSAIEPLWTGSTQMWEVDYAAGRAYTECGTSNICGVSFATPAQWLPLVQPAAVAGMDIDLVNRHVYWADHGAGYEKNLLRANLDGTGVTGIMKLPFAPLTVTVDPGLRKIYWATGTGISEAGIDGRNDHEIIPLPGSYTYDIAVDARAGKLYFTDFRAGEVRRANLDGTGYEMLIPSLEQPQNIALYLCTP